MTISSANSQHFSQTGAGRGSVLILALRLFQHVRAKNSWDNETWEHDFHFHVITALYIPWQGTDIGRNSIVILEDLVSMS